jgi:predicted Ser/Thr protein kinase
MQDDNDKKIKYLAELLTVNKEGKVKSVEMVRRLPWTKTILEKVAKISKELLKYSGQK